MGKYKVTEEATFVVYREIEVEAPNEKEAVEIAWVDFDNLTPEVTNENFLSSKIVNVEKV